MFAIPVPAHATPPGRVLEGIGFGHHADCYPTTGAEVAFWGAETGPEGGWTLVLTFADQQFYSPRCNISGEGAQFGGHWRTWPGSPWHCLRTGEVVSGQFLDLCLDPFPHPGVSTLQFAVNAYYRLDCVVSGLCAPDPQGADGTATVSLHEPSPPVRWLA